MKKLYTNQVRNYVYEPYDIELDGVLTPLTKIEEIEDGFTLCEDETQHKYLLMNYGKRNQKVFVVCDILTEE